MTFKYRLLIIPLLALIILSLIPGTRVTAAPSSPDLQYNLQIDLDYAAAILTVHQTTTYTNRSGDNLKDLRFNVTPAYFQAFALIGATVDGKAAATAWDGTALVVTLPKLVRDGEQVQANLDYKITVPRHADRFGVSQGIIALGNFYPTLAVYVPGQGWHKANYVPIGDAFFTQIADYHVTVKLSGSGDLNAVTLAYTGHLLRHDGAVWEMAAERVRDFAIVASNRFTSSSIDVDGVKVVAYYLPEDATTGQAYLTFAAHTIRWMNAKIARYPYSILNVVEVSADRNVSVGQEYPTLVMISNDILETGEGLAGYPAYLVAHEVIHQWFYSLVGNDQPYEPWLDEALTVQFSYLSLDRLPRAPTATAPVSATIYDFTDENLYFDVVYARGAQFLMQLRDAMGNDAYMRFIRQYVATFQDQIAEAGDFIALAQTNSKTPLYPLMRQYLAYTSLQFDGPLPVEVQVPDTSTAWSGTVNATLKLPQGPADVQIRTEERMLWQGKVNGMLQVPLDTRPLSNDDHILRVVATNAEGRIGRFIVRFKSSNTAGEQNVPPTATSIPAATPAATATPVAIPTKTVAITPTQTLATTPTPSPVPATPTAANTPTATQVATPTATQTVVAGSIQQPSPTRVAPTATAVIPAGTNGQSELAQRRGDVAGLITVLIAICLILLPLLAWAMLRSSPPKTGERQTLLKHPDSESKV